jgi:hypothetical protein
MIIVTCYPETALLSRLLIGPLQYRERPPEGSTSLSCLVPPGPADAQDISAPFLYSLGLMHGPVQVVDPYAETILDSHQQFNALERVQTQTALEDLDRIGGRLQSYREGTDFDNNALDFGYNAQRTSDAVKQILTADFTGIHIQFPHIRR